MHASGAVLACQYGSAVYSSSSSPQGRRRQTAAAAAATPAAAVGRGRRRRHAGYLDGCAPPAPPSTSPPPQAAGMGCRRSHPPPAAAVSRRRQPPPSAVAASRRQLPRDATSQQRAIQAHSADWRATLAALHQPLGGPGALACMHKLLLRRMLLLLETLKRHTLRQTQELFLNPPPASAGCQPVPPCCFCSKTKHHNTREVAGPARAPGCNTPHGLG